MSVVKPIFPRKEESLELPGGNIFKRMLAAKTLAIFRKSRSDLVAAEMWPNDRVLGSVLKATSAPAMTTTTGWAAELFNKIVADAVDALGLYSAAIEIMQNSLVLGFDGYGQISVPAFVASSSSASFVAEGDPIPVRQFAATAKTINPFKVAAISVLTREMMESSNAESLISDVLVRSAALAIDAAFFDNNAATSARPAGIRNGISSTTASSSTDLLEAFLEDMSTLIGAVGAVGGKGPFYLVANVGRAASMGARFVSESGDIIPVMSASIGNDMIAIAPQAIAVALSIDPDIEIVPAGTLVMDTAPGPAGVAGPERSLFQTDSFAIKVRWPVSWVVRDSRGVAWTTPAWK